MDFIPTQNLPGDVFMINSWYTIDPQKSFVVFWCRGSAPPAQVLLMKFLEQVG